MSSIVALIAMLALLIWIGPNVIRYVKAVEGKDFIWQSALIWGGLLIVLSLLAHHFGWGRDERMANDNIINEEEETPFTNERFFDQRRHEGTDL